MTSVPTRFRIPEARSIEPEENSKAPQRSDVLADAGLTRLRTARRMWRLDVSSEAELEIFEAALRCERGHIGFGVRFWSTKLSFPVSIHRKSTPYGEVELEPFVHQPRRTANGESVTEVEVHAMLENATGLIVH